MVYPGQYPDYGKNEFTWAVRFQENGNRYRMAIINADTGEVIDATLH
jgi:hypothetical protein